MEQLIFLVIGAVVLVLVVLAGAAFLSGAAKAFKRNWWAALLLLIFGFPFFLLWVGIEVIFADELAEADEEE